MEARSSDGRGGRQLARDVAWFIVAWVVVASTAVLVVALVARVLGSSLHRTNLAASLALHRIATHDQDVVALALTRWGADLGVAAVVIVAIVALLRLGRRLDALVMIPLALGGIALVAALKEIIREPRPHLFTPLRADRSYGFPSGHACSATWLYGYLIVVVLAAPVPRCVRWSIATFLVALGFAIAWSRVYLGGHWLADEIGGAAIGAAWLAVCLRRHATLGARRPTAIR